MPVEAVNSDIQTGSSTGNVDVGAWEKSLGDARDATNVGIRWERPEGDNRSADEIINDSTLLKNLGNQGKGDPDGDGDANGVQEMLTYWIGDYRKDPDAAFRAAQVLDHVEKLDANGNRIAGNDLDNGSIDGFTGSGEAKHGTEAGRLQDFGKHGFSSLRGELDPVPAAASDNQAREEAEKLGLVWERPDGDDRSVTDIIDANPLLQNLGNQSGVKDMLKERVGDFERDADAAFRAMQVVDRLVMFDEKGNRVSGDGVANDSIDGFTKSGEAKHDTEAGRLQDFGKYGFSSFTAIKPTSESSIYRDFVKNNSDADDASKKLVEYAAFIGENYDIIRGKTGSGDYLTPEALKQYKEDNTHLSDQAKEALDFWSQPGALASLDTAQHPLEQDEDGRIGTKDISSWINNQAPTDAGSVMAFLAGVADGNAASKVDTSSFTKDIFDNPGNYSAEEKAAVLNELVDAQQLIIKGGEAGMWRDDKSQVQIANWVRSHPDPKNLLQDVNDRIAILEKDPEVAKFASETLTTQMNEMLTDNKTLKDVLNKTYESKVKSGDTLDALWTKSDKDVDQQAILAEFLGTARSYQSALGIEDAAAIQDAVKNSSHNGELQDHYEHSLASGDRLKELLQSNSVEEAASAFSMEVALYNAALDPEFTGKFDTELNENFTRIAQERAFDDASFEDMKTAFGVDGGDELDEEKVKSLVEEISRENPQFLLNQDGTVATPEQVLAAFRGNWDMFRNGVKTFDKIGNLSDFDTTGSAKGAYDRGVLHGVSGLFMAGITIAKGVGSNGNPTDRQIVDITTGSVMTASLLAEGGAKQFEQYLKGLKGPIVEDVLDKMGNKDILNKIGHIAKEFEEAAKGVGGMAGVAFGAYSIFDGVQSIRNGDATSGALSISTGSLATMAGLAVSVESGLGLLGATVPKMIPIMAGALGWASAGVGVIASLLPSLIEEGKQETRVDNFGQLLSEHLTKYGIDGVKNGDYWDIPDADWPGDDDKHSALSGS